MKDFDISPEGLIGIISQGESKWVEFKAKYPPDDIVSKHIVAFSNTDGGIMIFGVGDKGTILGIPTAELVPRCSDSHGSPRPSSRLRPK